MYFQPEDTALLAVDVRRRQETHAKAKFRSTIDVVWGLVAVVGGDVVDEVERGKRWRV